MSNKKDAFRMMHEYEDICRRQKMCEHTNLPDLLKIVGTSNYSPGANLVRIDEAIELFMKEKEHSLKKNSLDTYRYQLSVFRGIYIFNVPVREIKASHFENFIRNPNWSPASKRNRMRHLKAWWNYLLAEGHVSDPFPKIKLPPIQADVAPKMTSRDELDDILKLHRKKQKERIKGKYYHEWQSQDWFEPLMVLLYHSGIRISESLSLVVADIDLEEDIVKVQAQNSKTNKSRSVPVHKEATKLVKDYIEMESKKNHDLIFNLSSDHVYRVFKRYVKELGLNEKTLHGFRHGRVTSWLEMGFSTIEVAQMAGHSNLAVTMGYSHPDASKLKEKLDRLSGEGK
ncbi:MAG: site-specific integrase [Balneolia bacterium]|nr:site-specific integrase [Balneolia bacterium]